MREVVMQKSLADNNRTGSVPWSHCTPQAAHAYTNSNAEEKAQHYQ
jgi:hypothetical protein